MARFMSVPFAQNGNKTSVPDAVQPNGSISYTEGWGSDYELPNNDPDYRPISREQTNQLFFDTTEAVGDVQKQGILFWDTNFSYAQHARATGSNGVVYRAVQANSGQDPTTDTSRTNWTPDTSSLVPSMNIVTLTASGTYTKPSNLVFAKVYVTGGGSAGNVGGSVGGSAGGTAIRSYSDSELNTTEAFTIGAGGVGNGVSGGSSTFKGMTANGGQFSNGGTGGGTATGGEINIPGGGGGGNDRGGNADGGAGGSSFWSGNGGASGSNASAPGSFGSGGGSYGDPNGTGGNGGNGVVVIEEYLGV